MAERTKEFSFCKRGHQTDGGTQPRFSEQKMAEATKNIVVNNIPLQKSAPEHSKKVFGLENLREYQLEALSGLLQGRDTIISQPTGSGKSVVY